MWTGWRTWSRRSRREVVVRQNVEQVALNDNIRWRYVPWAYAYNQERGWRWLQWICFRILRALRCEYNNEVHTITTMVIDKKRLIDRLFAQHENLVSFFNYHPDRLLIGAKDWAELMDDQEVSQMISFDMSYHRNRSVYGLRVQIIPWMRGMLVMPQEAQ